MYYVYILQSEKSGKYYTGYCADIEVRLIRHNSGATPSTKSGIPWKLVYFENFSEKSEAIKRENEIKSKKSRKYIENLINSSVSLSVPIFLRPSICFSVKGKIIPIKTQPRRGTIMP